MKPLGKSIHIGCTLGWLRQNLPRHPDLLSKGTIEDVNEAIAERGAHYVIPFGACDNRDPITGQCLGHPLSPDES